MAKPRSSERSPGNGKAQTLGGVLDRSHNRSDLGCRTACPGGHFRCGDVSAWILELSTRFIPVATFGWILSVAEASAKPLALLLILVVLTLTSGGFAVLLVRWPRSRRWSLSLLATGTALGTFIVALGRGGSLFVSGLVAAGLTLVLVGD